MFFLFKKITPELSTELDFGIEDNSQIDMINLSSSRKATTPEHFSEIHGGIKPALQHSFGIMPIQPARMINSDLVRIVEPIPVYPKGYSVPKDLSLWQTIKRGFNKVFNPSLRKR